LEGNRRTRCREENRGAKGREKNVVPRQERLDSSRQNKIHAARSTISEEPREESKKKLRPPSRIEEGGKGIAPFSKEWTPASAIQSQRRSRSSTLEGGRLGGSVKKWQNKRRILDY